MAKVGEFEAKAAGSENSGFTPSAHDGFSDLLLQILRNSSSEGLWHALLEQIVQNQSSVDARRAVQPRRLTIRECCVWANVGRTHLYDLIRRGRIKARKDGRRTYILLEDVEAWLKSLPSYELAKECGSPHAEQKRHVQRRGGP